MGGMERESNEGGRKRDRQMGSEKWERWGERVLGGGREREIDRQIGSEKWEGWRE